MAEGSSERFGGQFVLGNLEAVLVLGLEGEHLDKTVVAECDHDLVLLHPDNLADGRSMGAKKQHIVDILHVDESDLAGGQAHNDQPVCGEIHGGDGVVEVVVPLLLQFPVEVGALDFVGPYIAVPPASQECPAGPIGSVPYYLLHRVEGLVQLPLHPDERV